MPDCFATSVDGLLLVANGVDSVARWDGLAPGLDTAGVAPPSGAVALSAFVPVSASGDPLAPAVSLTGTYYAYVRFVDAEGHVSNFSPLSEPAALAGAPGVTYTGVPVSGEEKVVRRQVLRNTAGQTAVFYVDVDTADLTSGAFDSLRSDALLAAQEAVALFDEKARPLGQTHGLPPSTKGRIAQHLDRMFLAGEEPYMQGSAALEFGSKTVQGVGTEWPATFAGRFFWAPDADQPYEIDSVDPAAQTLTLLEPYAGPASPWSTYSIRPPAGERRLVYFSEPGQPESWPATNAVSVQEDGDDLVGLMPKGSFLYLLERRHLYRLTFQTDPLEDGYVFLTAGRGCVNNRCWCVVDDKAYLMDEAGVYAFTGGQDTEPLSGPIQDLFEPARARARYRLRWGAQRWWHCCYDPGAQAVRWFVTLEGTGLPRHALCLDLRRQAWWCEHYPFPVGASCVGPSGGERRVFLGGPGGRVHLLGQGSLDLVDPGRGTVRGTATSAGVASLADSSASFDAGLVGAPLAICDGRGKGQVRAVTAVAGTTLRLDRPWAVRPDSTSAYQLGGLQWRYRTGWFRWADQEHEGPRRLELQFEPAARAATMDARLYLDRSGGPVVWGFSRTSAEGMGVRADEGSPDLVVDRTKASGFVQERLDGHKEQNVDGPRLLSWELRGTTNQDPVVLYQLTVDGAKGGGG